MPGGGVEGLPSAAQVQSQERTTIAQLRAHASQLQKQVERLKGEVRALSLTPHYIQDPNIAELLLVAFCCVRVERLRRATSLHGIHFTMFPFWLFQSSSPSSQRAKLKKLEPEHAQASRDREQLENMLARKSRDLDAARAELAALRARSAPLSPPPPMPNHARIHWKVVADETHTTR